MKRYRVWEANRKVFLWPENWLEPELRDDKSPFFKEIESELLQSDITEDVATTALLNYLSKLEEVAKLEPCGIYHVEADLSRRTGEIDHVIARTAGAHRKYYYRRREYGTWTPWEQVKLDIEDNPVIPVVWKDRLLLFWLRILKNVAQDATTMQTSSINTGTLAGMNLAAIQTDAKTNAQNNTKVTVQAVLCWSEYYNGKWQPTKTSDINLPTVLGQRYPAGFDRSQLQLASREGSLFSNQEFLRLAISGDGLDSSFDLYNTHSLPVRWEDDRSIFNPFRLIGRDIIFLLQCLIINYFPPSLPARVILRDPNGVAFRVTMPKQDLENPWNAPFFFADSRHVFFVTTTGQRVGISDYPDYGVAVGPIFTQVTTIPPLMLQPNGPVKLKPKFGGEGGPLGLDPGVFDSTSMQRFVTEDTYIRQGISTIRSVMYGNKQIGPAGALSNGRAEI